MCGQTLEKGVGTGSGSAGEGGVDCAVLADCCGTLGGAEAASCNQVADENDSTSCEALFSQLLNAGGCPG